MTMVAQSWGPSPKKPQRYESTSRSNYRKREPSPFHAVYTIW